MRAGALSFSCRSAGRNPVLDWRSGPVAQLVEQRTFNAWVAGSIPAGLTITRDSLSSVLLDADCSPIRQNLGYSLHNFGGVVAHSDHGIRA